MTRFAKWIFAAAISLLPSLALADYVVKDGNGTLQTIHAFTCSSTICPASVPIDNTGAAFGVTGNPFFMAFGTGVTLPAFAATPTFNIGTIAGIATAASQTSGAQKTQIVDGAGNVIASTSNNLNVQCANCSGSGVSTADGATFTAGSSLFAGSGGIFQTTATSNPVTNGHQGLFQMTAQRALFVNLRDSSGVEITPATAANQATANASLASLVTNSALPVPVNVNGTATALTGLTPGVAQTGTIVTANMDLTSVGGVAIGAMANYGTSPGAVKVQGVNAFVTNTVASNIAQANGATMSQSNPILTAEQGGTAYPNNTNWRKGVGSATGTSATTIITAPGANKLYIKSVHCSRDDAGTTAIRVTFNDSISTPMLLPNNGGGGANNANYDPPLDVTAATAFQFTASAGITTVRCDAEGYVAP